MKRRFLYPIFFILIMLVSLSVLPAHSANVTIGLPERIQEHSQWCWDASSKAILDYYGKNVSQCTIANWAFSRSDCCGNNTFYWDHLCNRPNTMAAIKAVLSNWGVSSGSVISRALTWSETMNQINAGRPFVMAFFWTSGGGHALAGYGYDSQSPGYLHYMDPWPGNGYTKRLYSATVSSTTHNWGQSLQVTSAAPATISAQVTRLWPVSDAKPGQASTLWAEIRNTGTVSLPSDARVWYYVRGPGIDKFVGYTSTAGLAAGGLRWYSFDWSIPASASAGTYTYWAIVYRGSTAVSTWSASQSFTVSSTATISAQLIRLWPVSDAKPGQASTLWAEVRNTGNVSLPSDARVWFYVRGQGIDQYVGYASASGLTAGTTRWYYFNWTIPASAAPGTYNYWARVHRGSTGWISDWSTSQSFTVGLQKAGMTSPTPGSRFTSTTVTFGWTNVGAAQYYLYLGNTVGNNNYASRNAGTATSLTVTGLPSDGTRVYARLWTRHGTTWYYNDYLYYAFSGGGFDEQFKQTPSNWLKDSGTWSLVSNEYWYTRGITNAFSMSTYNQNFTNFDFSARIWRYAGSQESLSNRIIVRASGTFTTAGRPYNAYVFQYNRAGEYNVLKYINGSYTVLKGWTSSGAINKGNAWNVVRVVASGKYLYYYINNTLVWKGEDTSLTSGRVGFGMYSSTLMSGEGFYVDWAKLSVLSSGTAIDDEISSEQTRLNDSASEALDDETGAI